MLYSIQNLPLNKTNNKAQMTLSLIIGVDEAGRGPLAGPVIASAVILKEHIPGITDSKKLSEKKRNILAQIIQNESLAFAYGEASIEEIDSLNIHHATLLAMQRAIDGIRIQANKVVIDGCFAPSNISIPVETIVQGDLLHPSISAASILAKVKRDLLMLDYDQQYPEYGFAKHKGYGTAQHLIALQTFGPCAIHRLSFSPVQKAALSKLP